jgi:CubicO group peptidase (beta-lactamase class C family)
MCARLCGLFIVLLAPAAAQPQTTAPAATQEFSAICREGRFSGVAAIQQHGRILFEGACGLANAEWGISHTTDTRFRAASIAKSFTGAAILLLQQDGSLTVDDPVGHHIHGIPESWRSATIHQLLTHTSGVPSQSGPAARHLDHTGATPRELLATVLDKPLQFPHGARLAYNNIGYVLLGMVIEKTSGLKYGEFVRTRVFAPLGMKDTALDESRAVTPRLAAGYIRTGGGLENAPVVDSSVAWSAGGFHSTVRDLIAWGAALLGGKLLNEDSTRRMFATYPETRMRGMHYGYGMVLAERAGRRLYYHGGGISGFTSVLQIYPDDGVIVVVLSNLDSESTGAAAWQVADRIAPAQLGWSRD